MNRPHMSRNLLTAAMLALLLPGLAVPASALAKDKPKSGQSATPDMFPQATRTPPEQSVSQKLKPSVMKLFKAYETKDTAQVLQLADAIIANPDGNAYDHAFAARLAGASLLNTDNAKAKAYLKRAIEFNGLNNNEHYESMRLIAQLDLADQDYAGGLATIDQLLQETHSTSGDDLALKGNALYRLKRYPDAITALNAAVAAGPEPKPEWLEMLMGAYFDSNQPKEADRIAEGLIAAHPDDKTLQTNLVASYLQAGQDDKAAALLEKMRGSGALSDAADYRNLYAMYLNQNKNKEGIAVIEEGLKKGVLKEDFATLNALAQAYWFSDQSAQAIATYRKAAPLAPDGEVYLNLARALLNDGQAAEAKQAAQQALAKGVRDPGDAKKIIAAGK